MGLLDDAIREHLELKRRHGADPTEVARQEHEALGPARRAAERDVPAVADEDEILAAAPEPELEPAEPFEYEPEPELEPEVPAEPRLRRIDPDIVEQPTVEHRAARPEPLEDLPAHEPVDAHDDDVLEGTPEFLEETPEHDRLWFEQRPPRDFDFDD